jgi:hypothetical protein
MYPILALLVDASEKKQGLKLAALRDDGSLEPRRALPKGHIG